MGCEDAQYKTQAAGTVANCVTAYDQDGRTTSVVEDNAAGTAVHTTTYGYDADFNQTAMTHDWAPLTYRYNTLEKLPRESEAKSATDASLQVTGSPIHPGRSGGGCRSSRTGTRSPARITRMSCRTR